MAEALEGMPSSSCGLTQDEAHRRLLVVGSNRLTASPRRRFLGEIARRLTNPLVLILLVAGVISALTGMALSVLAVVAALPFTPLGAWFGLVALPGLFYGLLLAMPVAYPVLLEMAKRPFPFFRARWHRRTARRRSRSRA